MNALDALMQGIIDYAGLFPPAQLPMQPVVENYAVYRQGSQRQMLGRLICPTTRFEELAASVRPLFWGWDAQDVWPIAALARGGATTDAFLAALEDDLAAMRTLAERCGTRLRIEVLECKLPADLIENPDASAIGRFAATVAERTAAAGYGQLMPYYEISFAGDWRKTVPRMVAGLAAYARSTGARQTPGGTCGVKVRTGGVEAAAFPSVDQVTCVIRACAGEHIALKATAGLHHPVRHFAESVQAKMHGFLNVFGAAVLTHAHDLDTTTIACIVEDEEPRHFRFDGDTFGWQNQSIGVHEIAAARRDFAHGFGSCSFDEPMEDLRALGLM